MTNLFAKISASTRMIQDMGNPSPTLARNPNPYFYYPYPYPHPHPYPHTHPNAKESLMMMIKKGTTDITLETTCMIPIRVGLIPRSKSSRKSKRRFES